MQFRRLKTFPFFVVLGRLHLKTTNARLYIFYTVAEHIRYTFYQILKVIRFKETPQTVRRPVMMYSLYLSVVDNTEPPWAFLTDGLYGFWIVIDVPTSPTTVKRMCGRTNSLILLLPIPKLD